MFDINVTTINLSMFQDISEINVPRLDAVRTSPGQGRILHIFYCIFLSHFVVSDGMKSRPSKDRNVTNTDQEGESLFDYVWIIKPTDIFACMLSIPRYFIDAFAKQ